MIELIPTLSSFREIPGHLEKLLSRLLGAKDKVSSFLGEIITRDFEIRGSSMGKCAPVCDKAFQELGTKPVVGTLQSFFTNSERSMCNVLETNEIFLGAAWYFCKRQSRVVLYDMLLQVGRVLVSLDSIFLTHCLTLLSLRAGQY